MAQLPIYTFRLLGFGGFGFRMSLWFEDAVFLILRFALVREKKTSRERERERERTVREWDEISKHRGWTNYFEVCVEKHRNNTWNADWNAELDETLGLGLCMNAALIGQLGRQHVKMTQTRALKRGVSVELQDAASSQRNTKENW